MPNNPFEWRETDLLNLVEQGVQESLVLEYKRCDALQKSDAKKNELSKDISALANSAGGVIVYGICEDGHVPTRVDLGYDPTDISKEWLEQVINSRIQRRIDGVRVNQVHLPATSPGKVAYVVVVPQSHRAPHQAADKRFYKRFNYESVPMEEYELRDVANRASSPSLDIEFLFKPGGTSAPLRIADDEYFEPVELVASIRNNSIAVAEYAVIHICLDSRARLGRVGNDVRTHSELDFIELGDKKISMTKLTTLWDRARGLPLFSGISAEIPSTPLSVSIPRFVDFLPLRYTIGAPNMEIKDRYAFMEVKNGIATFTYPIAQNESGSDQGGVVQI